MAELDYNGLGKWLSSQLTNREPDVISAKYPQYWGYEGMYHSAKATLPFGIRSLTSAMVNEVGQAVNYGGKATTIPLANYGIEKTSIKTVAGIIAAEWNVFDLEAEKAAFSYPNAGLMYDGLIENYRSALERALREWMHFKAVYGDSQLGMAGLLSNPNVTTIVETIAVNTLASAALHDWLLTQISLYKERNLLTVKDQLSLLVSPRLYLAMTKRFTDGGGGNVLSLLGDSVREVAEIAELTPIFSEQYGVTATGREMMVIYHNSEDVLDRVYAPIFTTQPKLLDDCITYRIVGYCATSEVRVKRKNEVTYINYPKA